MLLMIQSDKKSVSCVAVVIVIVRLK